MKQQLNKITGQSKEFISISVEIKMYVLRMETLWRVTFC